MKTLGIVGGIGPESTVEYYRKTIALYREKTQDGSYPPIQINSINMTYMLDLIGANDFDTVGQYLVDEIEKLAQSGADIGLLASNTPHIVFDMLNEKSPIPLISIVESACDAVIAQGLDKVALLGTQFTMQGDTYTKVFDQRGISIIVPNADEQVFVHQKYMGELVNGIILDETRDAISAILDRMISEDGIQGIILGGTELPLLFTDASYKNIPFFDTTSIHVASALQAMLAD